MIVFDANVLIALVSPKTTDDDRERLNAYVADIARRASYVGIPTPALAEFLIRTDNATSHVLSALERKSLIRVLPFDRKAALECALLNRNEIARFGHKRGAATEKTAYQKTKTDRQIVAIAMSNNAAGVLSDDGDIRSIASFAGLPVISFADLPLPESARQGRLDLSHERHPA